MIDMYRRELASLREKEANLHQEMAKRQSEAAKHRSEAQKKLDSARRTKSEATQRSNLRSAATEEKKANDAEKKVSEVKRKLAENAKQQAAKSRALDNAEKSERRSREQADQRKRREEIRHARTVASLAAPAVRYVPVAAPKPEPLRVLYLTANPEASETTTVSPGGDTVRQGVWLRTEAEVRSVQQELRGSKYRDQVQVELRPAATPTDIIQGINDVRPHVVHFSGHGGSGGILMDNGSVDAPEGAGMPYEILAEFLSATDFPPVLLVLNACDTLDGAEVLTPAVAVVIAMSASVSDAAASIFASKFYAGIASAQSVGSSLKQARAVLKATMLSEAHLPQHVAREGIEVDDLVLVRPPVQH